MPMVVYTAMGAPEQSDWQHTERNKRRMDYAAELGVDCFMFMSGPKPKDRPVNKDDIRAAAESAEAWAEYAAQYDLEISYHIHTNTLIDSAEHWRLYMSLLDRAKLCIDVSHAQLWGYDPVEAIRDYRDQLNYVHLQDYSSTSRGENGRYLPVWCDVGEAENVDFPSVLATLDEIGYDRWVTACPGEVPPGQGDPRNLARRSCNMRDYLRGLGW
jgi:sugar phosphate isomerase/epimerase